MPSTIRIGTRQSPLALWQAEHVAGMLQAQGFSVELVRITTSGDVLKGSLSQSGGVGLFTKEIQRALLEDRCDVAVHSLKDLPTEPIEGLCLSAVPEREDPSDCLITRDGGDLDALPSGSVVGTGSPRRRAQLVQNRPDLNLSEIRGNVDTRLKKLAAGDYDAIVLAYAGLHRLGLDHVISQKLPMSLMIPAVGQAALGLETRQDDATTIEAIRTLDHPETHWSVYSEREVLRRLRAGCLAPVAAHARRIEDRFEMQCRVFSSDFARSVYADHSIPVPGNSPLHQELAERLVQGMMDQLHAQRAEELIEDTRRP
ncbi:MAG: hydroxymethylbilane synthase [Pirellula sp.]|jgi:hydroxymethylbilane synthase|nr:hydroxymethylbilane synthase [Pirellula sp.]